ncbi:type I-C CRISPR-associated protein Cas8c/Csd1 [Elusimicrobiota bacterium]
MLMNELFLLYEKNKKLAGKGNDGVTILLPIAHNTKKADIEVVIDINGNFLRANCVKDNDKIIIPVTEQSAGRTISPEPHPLCDELQYLAGDYKEYAKSDLSAFGKYYDLLKSWNDSNYSHEKVKAVFKYIEKKSLLNNLINKAKLFETDENNKIKLIKDKKKNETDKMNLNGKTVEIKKIFIRFIIEPNIDNKPCETWKDQTLYDKWINFYLNKKAKNEPKELCYISGDKTTTSENHQKVIGNAKLISANDGRGFTYRGRFSNSKQALSIGYEISQKAHNALKWLLEKQKIRIGNDSLLLCWESNLNNIPNVIENTFDIFGNSEETEDYPNTQKEFSKRLAKAIFGYKKNLDIASKILILILEPATSGRMSVRMFRDFQSSSFLDNIENWHRTCAWNFTIFKDKETKVYIYAPALKVIATNIYGTEQNGFIKIDDKILRATIERLLSSVIDKKPIPIDIVKMAINKASNPMAYEKRYNWNSVLEIACALVKKSKNDVINKNLTNKNYKEVFTMALDENFKDRSYLYGRLLAVADRIEYRTFESGEDRQTNAKRYMSTFAQRPYKTWQIIYKKLEPYLNKLKKGESVKYQNLLQNIHDLFDPTDFINNSSLDGIYILGFECQGKDLRYKNTKENNEEATNE